MQTRRRHGWQRPLHSLQIVGMVVYSILVAAFYVFLGLLLGNRIAEITLLTLFSFLALSVMFLYVRCTAIDPTDKTSSRRSKKPLNSTRRPLPKLDCTSLLSHIITRFLKKMERKILTTFIRRQYLDPWNSSSSTSAAHMEPLLPFPLILKDDAPVVVLTPPNPKECLGDLSYCDICDLQVNRYSKHCRACNRCVEGFDHHCRWLNNCVGKRNYTTFFLLMVFVLLMLVIEGGTAVAIFVKCFTDKHGIEQETKKRLYVMLPRGLLATISVILVLLTAYSSAALGQLFFFHVVLIRKGMRTYDYIHAMREQNQSMQLDLFSDLDYSSDDSSDFDSPEERSCVSRLTCTGHRENENSKRLSIRVDGDPEPSQMTNKKNSHVNIDPWKLMKFSREKAQLAVELAREKLMQQKPTIKQDPLKPLQLETKRGPLTKLERSMSNIQSDSRSLVSVGRFPGSPGLFLSPRRRFSISPKPVNFSPSPKKKYRSNFDLRLTEVSQELDTYISRQVLWSNIKRDGSEASPR